MPRDGRVIAYIDVRALRAGGILDLFTGGKTPEEADYKQFVADTGFNYKTDLDTVLLAYGKQSHAWIQARFDYEKLEAYAKKQGGSCSGGICRLNGTVPGRYLSFARKGFHTLAFSSGGDPEGVRSLLAAASTAPQPDLPPQPVWFLLPAAVLKDESLLPSGTRTFATALLAAQRVTLAIGPKGDRFEAVVDARCDSVEQAAQALVEIKSATTYLTRMIARERQEANVRDLSGVLTKGEFHTEGSRLIGAWPLERVFFENLAAGAP